MRQGKKEKKAPCLNRFWFKRGRAQGREKKKKKKKGGERADHLVHLSQPKKRRKGEDSAYDSHRDKGKRGRGRGRGKRREFHAGYLFCQERKKGKKLNFFKKREDYAILLKFGATRGKGGGRRKGTGEVSSLCLSFAGNVKGGGRGGGDLCWGGGGRI